MKYRNNNSPDSLQEKHFVNHLHTDEQLWRFIQAGDTRALNLLFKRYYAVLLDYAIKLAHREDWSKDAIQGVSANFSICGNYFINFP